MARETVIDKVQRQVDRLPVPLREPAEHVIVLLFCTVVLVGLIFGVLAYIDWTHP